MHLIRFLNDNAGAFNLLFSLVVAGATVFYAVLTRRLVLETEHLRRAQTDPSVSVRIDTHDEFLNIALLIVENVGVGPAYNIELSASPDFALIGGRTLSESGLFKHGLRYLAPKQRISLPLANLIDQANAIEDPNGRFRFQVSATYRDGFGTAHNDIYPLDFLHLLGLVRVGTPALRSLANDLDLIRKSLQSFESGSKRLKIETFTAKDRAVENAELERWHRDRYESGHLESAELKLSRADSQSGLLTEQSPDSRTPGDGEGTS